MKLFELVGADKSRGFSPYVWRSRMALAHKGLLVKTVPLGFTDIQELPDVEAKTVPILEDGGRYIVDSWAIACYLEEAYPDRPLFDGETGKVLTGFFNNSVFHNLLVPLFPALVHDIYQCLDPRDQAYFRESREARLGMTLEEAAAGKEKSLARFRKQLWPYNATLKAQDYFCGARPAYADYIVYGLFQWARGVSPLTLLEEDEALYGWRSRMDDLYSGLGKTLPPKS